VAVLLLAALACSMLAAWWCTQTEGGRAFVARRVERLVTANIPGRLQIGKLRKLDGPHVEADDVRFFHPDGRCLLLVERASVDLDLADALSGRISFRGAVADGGYMILSTDPDGRLSFEATVNAKARPGQPSDPYGGAHYAMRSMYAKHFRVYAKLGPLDHHINGVSGYVGVRRIDTPGVQVNFERISGDIQPAIAGEHVSIAKLDGWIHGKEPKIAELVVALGVGSGELKTRVDLYDRDKDKLKLHFERKEGAEGLAVTWLMHLIAGFTSAVSVDG
jgi:hypothetical protein